MINTEGYITTVLILFSLIIAIFDGLNIKINGYRFSKWLFYDFSGLRFIYSKINPAILKDETKKSPATFLLWIIGIYLAYFGIASQRYKNVVDIIENRANAILAQLATDAYK